MILTRHQKKKYSKRTTPKNSLHVLRYQNYRPWSWNLTRWTYGCPKSWQSVALQCPRNKSIFGRN